MKKLKKMMALVLVAVMMMGMGIMTNAEESTQTYSITINNALKGETYTAYKIFDVTYSGNSYAYTISSSNEWFNVIIGSNTADDKGDYTLSDYGIKLQKSSTSGVYNVVNAVEGTDPTTAQMAALAAVLANNTTGKTTAGTGTSTFEASDTYGATTSVTINVNPDVAGYYFVTTTTGSLCSLNTSNPSATITEKNVQPNIDKKEALAEGTVGNAMTYTDTSVDMSIGDTVYFEIEVTDGKGTDAAITVHDTQSESLTLNTSSIKVYKDGTEVTAGDNTFSIITNPTDGCTFEVKFAPAYVAGLNTNDKVVIRYNAVLNEKAVIYSEENTNHDDNNNKVHLSYSGQSTQDVEVTQHTFKFQLVKDNSDKEILTGAKFKMYDSETGTTPIGFIKDGDTYRALDEDESNTTTGYTEEIEAGTPIFKGFGPGTYWFEETEAPTGYNKLTSRVSISVTSDGKDNVATFSTENAVTKYTSGGLEVTNQTGSILPSTGGIGTTIFYVIGAILVIGAGIILVTRKRMSNAK